MDLQNRIISTLKKNKQLLFKVKEFINVELIIDSLYVIFSLLVIPAFLLTLYKIYLFGFKYQFILDISVTLTIIVIGLFKHLIKYHIKLFVAVSGMYLIGAIGILTQGSESIRWIAFILVAVYAVLIYNIRTCIFSILLSVIIVQIVGWLHNKGIAEPDVFFKNIDSKYLLQISYLSEIILWLGLIIYIINNISKQLNYLLQDKSNEKEQLKLTTELLQKEIDENTQLQQKITQKEINFRNIFDESKDLIVICDIDCNYITSNKSFQKFIGENTYDFKQTKVYEILPPSCRDQFIVLIKKTKSKNFDPVEIELITPEGIKEFEVNTQIIDYNNDSRVMAIFRNITERKRSSKIIEESNNRWKITESAINIGIMDWNIETESITLSVQIRNILEIPKDKILKIKDIQDLVHPYDKDKYIATLNERVNAISRDEHEIFYDPIEYRVVKKSGLRLYIKEYGVLYFKNNKPVHYISVLVDNTEVAKSIKKIYQQKKNFSELIDAIQNSFLVVRGVNMVNGVFQDFVILSTNHVFLKTINKNIEDVFEKTIMTILPKMDEGFFNHCSDAIIKGRPIVDELYSQDFQRYFNITYQKIKYKSLFLIFEDITDKKMMQNNMINSIIYAEEKERARISKELHDGIGPLLSTLKMFTEKYCTTPKPEVKKEIEPQLYNIIDEAISNISSISNNLTPTLLERFGLNKALKRFINQLEIASECNIDFSMNTDEQFENKIEISVYRSLIEILNNSLKYSKPSLIKLTINYTGEIIIIDFSDNGKYFDFDKELTRRKGQGLFNIKNRIESIGGRIEYLGSVSSGVKYHLELPV